jgi:hypothetical protein
MIPLMPIRQPNGKWLMPGATMCADCHGLTGGMGEWYMLRPNVWEQAWPGTSTDAKTPMHEQHYLCIGCCERRLGRKLRRGDFARRKMHDLDGDMQMSRRLRSCLRSARA